MLLAEMEQILLGLMVLSLGTWLFLLLFWGQFWRVDQLYWQGKGGSWKGRVYL
ncbi:hypothetical protein [Cylindrospermopsis raciborskii]|uniref:hypothetical protein n=1 Tax=Cylindrospermopsis raciborskii TaxID=77022 RepID=UPI003A951FC6